MLKTNVGFIFVENLDDFFNAYMSASLWSSTSTRGEPLDDNHSIEDIQEKTRCVMRKDCAQFIAKNMSDIKEAILAINDYNWGSAGHDFWLTRNHHGAGFWDRGLGEVGDRLTKAAHLFGEADLFEGDDGQIDVYENPHIHNQTASGTAA